MLPLDDLAFRSCFDEVADDVIASPLMEDADPVLIGHLKHCQNEHYFSEYAKLPIDDLMNLEKLRCRFDEAMRFVLKKLGTQDQISIRDDRKSDNPRELRHNYPNTASDYVAKHMALGAEMMGENTH